jgi:hypothetical protein
MLGTDRSEENIRYVAAYFKHERDVLAAAADATRLGFEVRDVFTPFPVHGMDQAVGLSRSHLTWVAFFAGAFGLMFGLGLQVWTSAYDWPLNVGGKPFNSFPLFIPVTFELTVLFSGLIAIGVLLIRNRLWLFSKKLIFDRVTDDRFVMVLRQADASFDAGGAMKLLARHGALKVVEGDRFV